MDQIHEKFTVASYTQSLKQKYQQFIDWTTLYPLTRWIFLVSCLLIKFWSGFFVIAYVLSIHILSLLIGFLSPQIDSETNTYILPMRESEEYRPFQRAIPEFTFWYSAIRATLFALFLTLFSLLDIPVFWPILLVYFIFLMLLTLKEQIKNMVFYGYIPFSWGKRRYGDMPRESFRTNKFLNPFARYSDKRNFSDIQSKKIIALD